MRRARISTIRGTYRRQPMRAACSAASDGSSSPSMGRYVATRIPRLNTRDLRNCFIRASAAFVRSVGDTFCRWRRIAARRERRSIDVNAVTLRSGVRWDPCGRRRRRRPPVPSWPLLSTQSNKWDAAATLKAFRLQANLTRTCTRLSRADVPWVSTLGSRGSRHMSNTAGSAYLTEATDYS